MWDTIRKWWFLQRLEDSIAHYTLKPTTSTSDIISGTKVLSSKDFFIAGNEEHSGIADISVNRLSWLFFWKKKNKEKLLRKRYYEYNIFYEYLLRLDNQYIELKQIQDRPWPVLTIKGHKAQGYFGLFELLLKEYPLTWGATWKTIVFVITILTSTTVGSYYLIRIGNYIIPLLN